MVEVRAVLQRRRLPPGGGGRVDGGVDGVRLTGLARVANAAFQLVAAVQGTVDLDIVLLGLYVFLNSDTKFRPLESP